MPDTVSSGIAISVVKEQNVSSGAVSALSLAITQPARMVRIVSTADIYYAVGKAPVAATMLLPAGVIEYVAVKPGWFVAVKQVSVGGMVSIVECE